MLKQKLGPTTEKERHLILDILRGLALADIALANFPEFALWTFLSPNEQAMMPTAEVDKVVRFLQFAFVDGKFYTIFSILFGIGFSLILACIGFCHLMFIWSGDILLLYAVGGLLLPLFIKIKDKVLMVIAGLLIFVPVVLDALTEFVGIDFSGPFYDLWWAQAAKEGITEANFASWLRDADNYAAMFAFLKQGACERLWEIVSGHRLPKVLGLFIIGFLIGRHRFYARLRELPLKQIFLWTLVFSLPTSLLYAWSVVDYIAAVCLLFMRRPDWLAPLGLPGRMALTCYIMQSVIGVLLFYGLGLGLGTTFGLITIELTAVIVFLFQIAVCKLWLHYFRFGPLEWIWRMLTYGRYFPISWKE